MAEPSGYVRIFADEGDPMGEMLQNLADCRFMPKYVEKLLAVCRIETSSPSSIQQLIDPLTKREIEVLTLIGQGATNQDIADNLTIALTTTKKQHFEQTRGQKPYRSCSPR